MYVGFSLAIFFIELLLLVVIMIMVDNPGPVLFIQKGILLSERSNRRAVFQEFLRRLRRKEL